MRAYSKEAIQTHRLKLSEDLEKCHVLPDIRRSSISPVKRTLRYYRIEENPTKVNMVGGGSTEAGDGEIPEHGYQIRLYPKVFHKDIQKFTPRFRGENLLGCEIPCPSIKFNNSTWSRERSSDKYYGINDLIRIPKEGIPTEKTVINHCLLQVKRKSPIRDYLRHKSISEVSKLSMISKLSPLKTPKRRGVFKKIINRPPKCSEVELEHQLQEYALKQRDIISKVQQDIISKNIAEKPGRLRFSSLLHQRYSRQDANIQLSNTHVV